MDDLDEIDEAAFDDEDDCEAECGRWDQNAKGGMLPYYNCRLAGTEFCDWECPFAVRRT